MLIRINSLHVIFIIFQVEKANRYIYELLKEEQCLGFAGCRCIPLSIEDKYGGPGKDGGKRS